MVELADAFPVVQITLFFPVLQPDCRYRLPLSCLLLLITVFTYTVCVQVWSFLSVSRSLLCFK
jgi:hypothetical protein